VAQQMSNAWAASTRSTYASSYSGWLQFCDTYGLRVGAGDLGADVRALQRYLAAKCDGGARYATIRNILTGVQHWLSLAYRRNLSLVEEYAELQWQLRGIQRELGDGQRQKVGLSRAAFGAIMCRLDCEWQELRARDEHEAAFSTASYALGCVLCFFGMLRASELLALRWADLTLDRTADGGRGALWMLVRRSKTDQFGVGRHTAVSLAHCDATAPLLWWCRYETEQTFNGGYVIAPQAAVVRQCRDPSSAAITYAQWLRFLRARMVQAGLPAERVGSHSLRRGGASAAMAAGVPLTSVMAMAGWRSVSSALLYTTADDEHVVAASARLGSSTADVAQARAAAAQL
jgi:integrase